jgi:hypothetical protein
MDVTKTPGPPFEKSAEVVSDSEAEYMSDSEAEYMLEYLAVCPHCGESIKTLHVIRLLRTRVHFISTLPRHGRVLTCSACRGILGGELTVL